MPLQDTDPTPSFGGFGLNGEKRFYDMAVEPLCNDAGVVEGVTCAALDITERKRIEQKLRRFMENLGGMVEERTAELSDANEKLHSELKERRRLEVVLLQSQKMDSIGRLAGGVAHDLNNLLTPIMGYVSVAMASLQPEHPIQSKLQGIQKAAQSASELTLQLLAFSRNQVMDPALINLSDLILSMDKLLRRLIIEDIELVCVPGKAIGSVRVDPAQMEQVLMNLAVNARDAMPEGGRLVIETTDVTLDERYASRHPGVTAGDYVSLVVSDNGIGMTEEVKRHAFEPFFTTKEVGEGTGLGLSTCYGIVKQSGGHITVDSEPGQGTTFKIYIPRVDGEPSARPSRDDPAYLPRGSETVLLAEDEPTVRGVITDVLSESGYRVLEATNGHEALSVAQEHCGEEIHLLLTDVVMPLMGGRELAEILRAKHPNLKVLYTSGYADDAIDRHGVLEPDAEFIQKPFTLDVLTQKVRKALETG